MTGESADRPSDPQTDLAPAARPAGSASQRRSPLGFWAALWLVSRHRLFGWLEADRLFDDRAFERIEEAIAAGETRHRGEIRFALEQGLSWDAARRVAASREHALATFAQHGIWDTEENTGVLIFVQWPLHAIEIVADRGAARVVPQRVWTDAVERMARCSEAGRAIDGIVEAIGLINDALAAGIPVGAGDGNELPNRSIRL